MIKAFLSHSSKDKEHYVRNVANWLGKENIIYDEFTFEEGEKTLDQIMEGLGESELFVLFISNSALESKWVRKEIIESKALYDAGVILKIFPIIIDSNINHEDKRIPAWLRKHYNLQPITRTKIAASRIKNHLYKISWQKHPKLEKINSLFVGRNEKLEEFEERINDYAKKKPTVIFSSGLIGIGRRTFLSKALIKSNIQKSQITPYAIYLDRNESIEDFILKLNDLGIIDINESALSLSEKSIEEKQEIIIKILNEAYKAKETIFFLDDGCIINYKRELSSWFRTMVEKCNNFNYPVLCIASRYRVNFSNRPRDDRFYFIELSELNTKERKRLLSQLLEIEEIRDLDTSNFNNICDLLTGLPEQVKFAIELIKDKSIIPFENKFPMLSDFNNDKASIQLQRYVKNETVLDFVRLLAQFEVITLDFIFSIIDRDECLPILEELIAESICELVGSDGEMVRLNDIVRDYIKRNRLKINEDHNKKLNSVVRNIVNNEELIEANSSVYVFTIKEMLKSEEYIDPKYLIPSHYLRCMKDLYNTKGSLDKVISLADAILQKENNMESGVVQDVRYYLCLALAKKSDRRLLAEVQKIRGDEHKFLLGFYFRKCGRFSDALKQFESIINAPYVDTRAKRELVQVYTHLEEYDKALNYAKKNYEENRSNQFHCQAYFNCLINSQHRVENDNSTLKEIINMLLAIDSEQSNEMAKIASAMYAAKIENDETKSIDEINDCISMHPESPYPLLAKCDVGLKFKSSDIIAEALQSLEKMRRRKVVSERTLITYQAYLAALQGDENGANKIIAGEISRYPHEAKERIFKRIKDCAGKN
ncbi:Putative TPR repeat-containing protein [Erwinia billingiae Eb661]|uniref:Putative TPR repeat-containing protein n=1 Tax=Erwinia billingiae (strain Eb661) TaxID=634500 RepID=D8MXD3_ERWBE|nr:toll/interleukin-1 receptor domain-containing protein [Erwinia billingiae]CAX61490.1 Putative TPR repeat-containing protein [Erwinia billingiae Eb661]